MSDKNTAKKKKPNKQKLAVRIICIILAALMVGGGIISIVMYLTAWSFAEERGYDESLNVFVGLAYGDSTVSSASFQSTDGFSVGTVDGTGKFTLIASTSASSVTAKTSSSSVVVTDSAGNRVAAVDGSAAIRAESGFVTYKGNGNTYEGLMKCTAYGKSVQVVNVVPIETYVAGVIPNEISADWNFQTECAFAVTVRSYTLSMLKRHSAYDFDICATTHCQVYRGTKGINKNVLNAVNMTKGIVMTYKGKIVQAFYSDSGGGCSVSAEDVWGGTYGYLKAKAAPWEKYRDYKYGTWTVEYTPKELYYRIADKGYTGLDSSVASVKIGTAPNSTYVNSITFTDVNGHTLTVERCDRIRSLIGGRSANFVVGKAGGTVSEYDYYALDQPSSVSVMTSEGQKTMNGMEEMKTVTANGKESVSENDISVKTAYGVNKTDRSRTYQTEWERLVYADKKLESHTVALSGSSGCFVFYGRGNGHGVGMSQHGAKDLGDLGADFKTILDAYFTDITLEKVY